VLSPYSERMVTVDSGKEFSVEARGAFDDVDDISTVPDTVHADLRRPSPDADSRASGRWSSDRQERLAPVAISSNSPCRQEDFLTPLLGALNRQT
jgi:hypothetical protein